MVIIDSTFQIDEKVSARITYENDFITFDFQDFCYFTLEKATTDHFVDLVFDTAIDEWLYEFSLADNEQEYEVRLKNVWPTVTHLPEIPAIY
jgi:hypothetical protein